MKLTQFNTTFNLNNIKSNTLQNNYRKLVKVRRAEQVSVPHVWNLLTSVLC